MKRILLGILAGLYFIAVVVFGFTKYDFLLFGFVWFGWYGLPLWDDVQKRWNTVEIAQFVRRAELWAGNNWWLL